MNYLDLLKLTAARTLDLTFEHSDQPGGIRWRRWDWSIGVAFYGLWKTYEMTRDEEIPIKMKQWIDQRIDAIEKICVNSNSLLMTMLELNERDPDEKYEKVFQTFDRYLMIEGRRTPSGALEHTVLDNNWAHQVWADTIFMSLLYLAQRGLALRNEEYRREAYKQLDIHCKLLFDPQVNLFVHGWHDVEHKPIGVHWGRGNAWMTAGIVELLEIAPEDLPQRRELTDTLHKQLQALSGLQDPSGLWRTVLNHEETYLETSVTAGVAYGVMKGIRLGLIDPKFRGMGERALSAVADNIDQEGYVTGGSTGTPVKANALEYNRIAFGITPFTQGLALLALCEAVRGE
ncbi:hypothetical protein PN4B1_24140 [Paenibacillus naphthalenovorans]|uniref:glycoside hydrolase family 88/105 protein n=1 Tax=Paenibacillus naphthalenovorans TaxID=162209 RepID=UPI0010B71AA6|nr:glycoside hydrolase family 88 protein [Paenibacillus naphthalenovorans]GCL72487.1 hypothetical protein PN4B1_24140 [Paenibacillus naphthalenovorans]